MANNQQNEQEKKKKKKRLAIILPICLGLPVLAGAGVGIWWGVTHKAPIDEGIKLTKGAWVEQYNEDGPRVEELSGGS